MLRSSRIRRPLLSLLAVLLAPLTSARAQSPTATPADVAGCYRVTSGAWSQRPVIGPPAPTVLFRLDTLPSVGGMPGDMVAERLDPAEFVAAGDRRLARRQPVRWRARGADSVEVFLWSIETELELFAGRRDGASLRGVVRRVTNEIPIEEGTRRIRWEVFPWAESVAERVTCPA
jgi:hypothetical protein